MFRRIVVAMDGSDEGRAAASLAAELADQFGATVQLVPVTEHSSWRHAGPVPSEVRGPDGPRGRELSVTGATSARRAHELVACIAAAADQFGADLIVLGLERRRVSHHTYSRSLRAQLTRATSLPVMVAPRSPGHAVTAGVPDAAGTPSEETSAYV
jgi:nucleotide-binding universal stress UspA family protein